MKLLNYLRFKNRYAASNAGTKRGIKNLRLRRISSQKELELNAYVSLWMPLNKSS